MKTFFRLLIFGIVLTGCSNQDRTASLEKQVDSLQKEIGRSYKPGFGEFMSSIQNHHAKLWFAGIHANWQLANFEMHEMRENIEALRHFARKGRKRNC